MSEKRKKRIWFLPKPLLISAAASLLLAIIFAVAVSLAGSRLYDQQAEVTVADYDTKNSAITGDFEWSPFVITTSSKPIVPNTQVRLA